MNREISSNWECKICGKDTFEYDLDEHKRHDRLPVKYWFYCKDCLIKEFQKKTKLEIIQLIVLGEMNERNEIEVSLRKSKDIDDKISMIVK